MEGPFQRFGSYFGATSRWDVGAPFRANTQYNFVLTDKVTCRHAVRFVRLSFQATQNSRPTALANVQFFGVRGVRPLPLPLLTLSDNTCVRGMARAWAPAFGVRRSVPRPQNKSRSSCISIGIPRFCRENHAITAFALSETCGFRAHAH